MHPSTRTAPPLKKPRWRNVISIITGQSTQALAFGSIALFLPLIRADLGITYAQAGFLAAASTLTYALMQIPSGYIADRFNAKTVFFVGLLGVNVMSFLFAILADYTLLLANQAVSGVFRSLLFTPGLVLISRQFREDQRATAMGLFVAGGFSSNILVNLLAPVLLGPLGWQGIILLFSISGLLVAVLFWKLEDSAWDASDAIKLSTRQVWQTMLNPIMAVAGVIQFVRLAVVTGMGFWMPSILIEDKGFSVAAAGLVVALAALITAPSNFLGGYLSDRWGRPLTLTWVAMLVLSVTTVALTVVEDKGVVVLVVAVNAFFLQLYFGPLFAVTTHILSDKPKGLLSGIGNLCANVGGFVTSFSMGLIKEGSGSFDLALLCLAGLCFLGIFSTLFLHKLSRGHRRPLATERKFS